jgi:hypothetical protein
MKTLMISARTLSHAIFLGVLLTMVACRAPKPDVPEKAPVTKAAEPKTPEPELPPDTFPALPDDGIRMGNMLDLPSDEDFRTTQPNSTRPGGNTGPVIARPPTDPPSRVKPEPTVTE